MPMDRQQLVSKYLELHTLYMNTPKRGVLAQIESLLTENRLAEVGVLIKTLKDRKQLLDELSEKLKGKPVYYTLSRIFEGKIDNKYVAIKGLSSLMTHIAIEAEKGNLEYVPLLKQINSQYNSIVDAL